MTFPERIASIYNYASIKSYLIILGCLAVFFLICYVFLEKANNKMIIAKTILKVNDQPDNDDSTSETAIEIAKLKRTIKKGYIAKVLTFIILVASILVYLSIYGLLSAYQTAKQHGYQDGLTVNAESLWRGIHNSPEESKLPENPDELKQSLIIYYRFGCRDCEAHYQAIKTAVQPYTNVYWISSRSEQGKQLRETYPVEAVPTGVYITKDGTGLTYVLYTQLQNQTRLNEDELQSMLKALRYDRGIPE